jgi:hypothetical protein
VIVGGLVGLALIWLVVTGLLAKRQVSAAESWATHMRSAISAGDLATAATDARRVRQHAHSAHQLTTGPAWWVTAQIPWLGRPLVSVRGCADQADVIGSKILEPLVDVAQTLTVSNLVDRGTVRLPPIAAAAPTVSAARARLSNSRTKLEDLPGRTWLHSVDKARTSFADTAQQLQVQLDAADRVTSVVPEMLGAGGTKRYFVGLENEAESRGLGGVPGAFAIATANHGKLSFTQFESDATLYPVRTNLNLGKEFNQRYGLADPANHYENSTISPDFRDAAQIWSAMWQKYSGQRVDGAIAIDPTAISYLLKVTGPAALPDGTSVSAENVVALTQQTLYVTHPNTAERKTYLLQIATAISNKLLQAPGSASLISAATKAAAQRRIVVWSADPKVENTLRETSLSGTLEPGDAPFAGFTTTNAAGGKLDYYLERQMSYVRSGCGTYSSTTSTFTVTNAVPVGELLPIYVTPRQDKPPYPTKPGDNKILVSYYATPGSEINSVTVDGVKTIVVTQTEKGLTVFTLPLELPRGTTHTIDVTLTEPPRTGPVQILRQPSVDPIKVTTFEALCR